MSLDASLKTAGALSQHRNVLTRAERVVRLKETKNYNAKEKGVLHLPKTGNRKTR